MAWRTLKPKNDHRKAIQNTRRAYMAWSVLSIANFAELAYAQCACMLSAGKMANLMYGHLREGALDLRNA